MSETDDSGVARRDRRDRAWWGQAIARMEASGMGLAEFAQQEDIAYATLRRWRSRLKRRRRGEQVSSGKSIAKFLALPLTSRAARGPGEAEAAMEVHL